MVIFEILFFGALAIATMIGWIYFWILFVSSADRLLKPIFGSASLIIAGIGFPVVFFGLLLLLVLNFGNHAAKWFGIILGIALPIIGILAIKNDKFPD